MPPSKRALPSTPATYFVFRSLLSPLRLAPGQTECKAKLRLASEAQLAQRVRDVRRAKADVGRVGCRAEEVRRGASARKDSKTGAKEDGEDERGEGGAE